ncbi:MULTISPECIES: hypothetical protein [unclassified Synechococcus]|uniref:hypothetical protein n=1 Tax=unclassified Synechococcus TaxID=2626047 RepID=UPI0039C29CEE
MATTKKPPKKKLPTGPTKADLLSRMGVNKQPELPEPVPVDCVDAPHRPKDNKETQPLDLPRPGAVGVEPEQSPVASPRQGCAATTPPEAERIPLLADAPFPPEAPSLGGDLDVDPLPVLSPAPVEQVNPAKWATLPTEGQAELLPPATTCTGDGVHQNGAAKPADPREALDAQLGLQKLTLKWSIKRVQKLGSLQSTTGLPGEILLEVLLDHWERLPKALQQECLLQAHRIRVERLVVSQNFTIATIEQLLSNC